MKLAYFYTGGVGLLLGAITSIILNVHSARGADPYSLAIFGIHSTTFIKGMTLAFGAFVIAITAWVSLLIRDNEFPSKHPGHFFVETVLSGIIPASVILMMYYTRKESASSANIFTNFWLLAVKFMFAHLLLQFSGVYSSIFSSS
jgi:hypothetical protein